MQDQEMDLLRQLKGTTTAERPAADTVREKLQ
jgi:hypothetical protein